MLRMVRDWSALTTLTMFPRQDRGSNGHRKHATIGTGPKRTQGGRISSNAETLIDDFFDEVERVLGERGISTTVVGVEEMRRSK
jgi:hypothetical protein